MVGDRHPIYFDILQHPVTFLQNKIKTKTSTYNLLSLRFIFIRLAHTTYYLYALFSFIYNAVNVLSFIYSTKKVKEIDKRSKTFKGFWISKLYIVTIFLYNDALSGSVALIAA